MNTVGRQLLLCLSAYAHGQKKAALADRFTSADSDALRSLASIHKLTAVVYDKMSGNDCFCSDSPELLSRFRREAILQSTSQCARTAALLSLTNELTKSDVPYVLVKGVVCRELYASPDLRHSADEDIYVPTNCIKAAEKVLGDLGYAMCGNEDGQVTHWRESTSSLHIELHSRLTSSSDEIEEYFASHTDNRIEYPVSGGSVYTFDHTTNLIFMVYHAKKHLIAGGFGIRTLCDIALFAHKYGSFINKDELYRVLDTINSVTFFRQMLAIARDHIGIDAGGWDVSDVISGDDLLDDIMGAGVYGQSTMSRRHSASLTVAAAENTSLGRALFPSAETMKNRYPFVKKYPILLPVGWCKRIIDYSAELIRSDKSENSPSESIAIHQKRTKLLKKYGIIGRTDNT